MSKAPNWTPVEEYRLLGLLDQHLPYAEIGRRLGRSAGAVQDRAMLLREPLLRAGGHTPSLVGRLLGVEQKTVVWWIRQGWLRAEPSRIWLGRGFVRFVRHRDLLVFLDDERYWHLVEPERIRDRVLRLRVLDRRDGLEFLTTGQAGERLGLTHYAVNALIREGRIRAVKRGPNWLIRSDHCVYPEWLPRTKGRRLRPEDDAFIRQWWGKRPATWMARQLGLKSEFGVTKRGYQLGLPHVGRGYWKKMAADVLPLESA